MSIPQKYQPIVTKAVTVASGLGVTGAVVPQLDSAGLITIWSKMIVDIAAEAGYTLTEQEMGQLAPSILMNLASRWATSKTFSLMLAATGISALAVIGSTTLLNSYYTYQLAKIMIDKFEHGEYKHEQTDQMVQEITASLKVLPSQQEGQDILKILQSA
jgi:O-antigen/teichoic acid export membrane protein